MSNTPPEIAALMTMVASMEQRITAQDARVTAQDARIASLEERLRHLEQERRPPAATTPAAAASAPAAAPPATLDEARQREKEQILTALQETGWNRVEVGRRLGIPRRTLYRRMLEYGIQEGDSRTGVVKREKARQKSKKKG